MKIIFLCGFIFLLGFSGYSQSENDLKMQLKNDPVFIKYNNARLAFITGIVNDKWGNLKSDNQMIKDGLKKAKNHNEIKELYSKAGVDSGYGIALNKLYYSKAMVAKKYKAIIKSNPEMWERVTKELTSSVPKPPPLHLVSPH